MRLRECDARAVREPDSALRSPRPRCEGVAERTQAALGRRGAQAAGVPGHSRSESRVQLHAAMGAHEQAAERGGAACRVGDGSAAARCQRGPLMRIATLAVLAVIARSASGFVDTEHWVGAEYTPAAAPGNGYVR
eukprot:COSAG03_NODE_1021_length_5006_cov_4.673935_8_plen_135_part_00